MKLKKLIAAMLCGALLLTTVGCSTKDTTWAAKYDAQTMNVGTYIFYLLNAYDLATTKVDNAEDLLKQTIEELPADQWIMQAAQKDVKRYYAVEKQFAAEGLTISPEEQASLEQYVQSQLASYGDFLAQNGISEAGLMQYYSNNYKSNTLFMKLYGKDGEKAVTDEELIQHFTETFTNSQYMLFPKFDQTTGEAFDEFGLQASKDVMESYYKQAEETENFEDVMLAWEKTMYGYTDDQHAHATPGMHDMLLPKVTTEVPAAYLEAINKAEVGTVIQFEDDQYFYVAKRVAMPEGTTRLEEYREQLLIDMRSDEYKVLVDQWIAEIESEISLNNDAISFYTPSRLKL